jgi:hypothetical protein
MWKYFLAWFPMVLIAIANGVLRQSWYGEHLAELRAHQVSTLTAAVVLGAYMWAVIRRWRPDSATIAIGIGLMWLLMTVCFEFLFGHFVAGHSWERLLHDYDFSAGRLWLLLLAWVMAAPYLFFRLRA